MRYVRPDLARSTITCTLVVVAALVACKHGGGDGEVETSKRSPAKSAVPVTTTATAPSLASVPILGDATRPRYLRRMRPDVASASSTLEEATDSHSAGDAFDDDRSTAWIVASPADGKGAWIEARFLESRPIWGVVVDTGMVHTDATRGDLFTQHAHAKKLRLRLDDDDVASVDVGENVPSIAFSHLDARTSRAVRLVVEDSWPGAEPFGMSEIAVLLDASRLPSVPESIVVREVKGASTRRDAAAVLHRFGVNPPANRGGQVAFQSASLVDDGGRERLLVVTFLGDPDAEGLCDEDDWIVFLGTTDDARLVSLGSDVVSARTRPGAPISIDTTSLHVDGPDDVVATWNACGADAKPGCSGVRAWTVQRGFPERIADVASNVAVTIAEGSAPHAITTGGRTYRFDLAAFDYR